jgi:hypothetical protein
VKIITLFGVKGSGKDSAAQGLVEDGWVAVALADPLKRFCRDLFQFDNTTLFGASQLRGVPWPEANAPRAWTWWEDARFRACCLGDSIEKLFRGHVLGPDAGRALLRQIDKCEGMKGFSARDALQQIGTDWGRTLWEDIWITEVKRVIDAMANGDMVYRHATGAEAMPGAPVPKGFVITDGRFLNELDETRAWGGAAVWCDASKRLPPPTDPHPSEPKWEEFKPHILHVLDCNTGVTSAQKALRQYAESFTP